MWFLAVFLLIGLARPDPEFVTKKLCKDVDRSQCQIYTVVVDPCTQGPVFCNMKRDKKYALTLNLSPKFTTEKLKLSMNGDVKNDGSFSTVIQEPVDGCGFLTCPLHAEERRIFDVDLVLDKRASGKFPIRVKLWNEGNVTQACCFTFNVKVK